MSSLNSNSPNSGKLVFPENGGSRSDPANRTERRGSISDGEVEDEDDEAVPQAELFNESVFRKMYVTSDFSAKKATGKLASLHIPPEKLKESFCQHGLKLGLCTENSCCEIMSAKITRSDRRLSGKFTGRKLVEYHILVTLKTCQASVWHRYSGFRAFYELVVEKYGSQEFSMFPRRHINKWSKAVTEERLVALDSFLQVCVENPKYRNDPLFKDFLSVDENARRQFYEPSQTQSHDIEIRQLSKEFRSMKSTIASNLSGAAKKTSSNDLSSDKTDPKG